MANIDVLQISLAFRMFLIMLAVAVVCGILLNTNFFDYFKTSEADTTGPDNCEFCLGAKGGVKGNENRFANIVVCDYCTVLLLRIISVTKYNSRHASAREQIDAVNGMADGRNGPICGVESPVGYVCNLKPGHVGRHTLKLDGESFLFWDDPKKERKPICTTCGREQEFAECSNVFHIQPPV